MYTTHPAEFDYRRAGPLPAEADALISAACRIAEEQVEKHQTEEEGRSRVAALDPRVSAENATLLYAQGRYSAWRDGYH